MGVELEVSELAVLRPIQTAAATRPPGNDDGPDAADTGCVTPTAASALLPPQLGVDAAADAGCFTPAAAAASSLLPRQLGLDIDAAACATPTASPCVLRAATVCPPAPRKPARQAPDAGSKRKRCCTSLGLQQRSFFPVPRDLSTVFVPRGGPAASASATATAAPRSPPRDRDRDAKKIRLHLVV
ncbi:hypothetical protein U9M48_026712 [Paspalum notatum var. saurae]|uniref:Uncharacterized protein n=1 Tax=Paspalum notatum var. saurae TaxID=547442 RepID=A0AAQ3TT56_PASNO